MPAAKMHETFGAKALNVLALPDSGGWRYFAEVVDRHTDAAIRVRAVGPIPYPSAVSALAQGMAYARALASGDDDGGRQGLGSDELAASLIWT